MFLIDLKRHLLQITNMHITEIYFSALIDPENLTSSLKKLQQFHKKCNESKSASKYFNRSFTPYAGSFLLANTRFTSRPGYVGRLHGPVLPGNFKYCLRFHYALHGFMKIDNALALYIYDDNNVAQEKIWTVSATSRDVWTEVDITFQKPMPTKVKMDSLLSI